MALTRKFLSALGIDADKVDEIIEAHSETVNALKAERDGYKETAAKADDLQKELDEAKKSLESNDGEGYKTKYDDLKAEYDKYKSDIADKETLKQKETAYRKLLTDCGVSAKRMDSILKLTDLKEVELDDKNGLKNADKLQETIKKEWSDFITTDGGRGAGTETPPAVDNGNGNTKKEIPLIF